jgi:branched-subunit amino acid transport protein
MVLATFMTRAGLLLAGRHFKLSPRVEAALRYAPVCALAVLIVPEVVVQADTVNLSLANPRLAGALGATAAVVIGDLTRCTDPKPPTGEPDPEDAALTVILDHLRAAGTPAAVGAPLGHESHNEAVPFGAACELDLDRGAIRITEAAVA